MSNPMSFRPDAATAAVLAAMPGNSTGEKIRALAHANAETNRRLAAMNNVLSVIAERADKPQQNTVVANKSAPQGDYVTTAEFRATMAAIVQAMGFVLAGVESPSSINREGYRPAVNQLMQNIKKGAA